MPSALSVHWYTVSNIYREAYLGLRELVRRFCHKDAGYADLREVNAHPPVGSVSSGTMRPEDLVPCFMEILREYSPEEYQRIASDIAAEFDLALCELHDGHPAWRSEFMTWILNEDIWDAMNDIALDGTRFSTRSGDGADWGYWPIEPGYTG